MARRKRGQQRQQQSQPNPSAIMSSGKRLAKRSIIGTRVCAPGDDGKYYSGVISAVNTPSSPHQPELAGLSITPYTRYCVRFDPVPPGSGTPPSPITEFSDRDLIGPGFASVTGAKLVAGQKVYLTYNGREVQAEVIEHKEEDDEVQVLFTPSGQEDIMSLRKRIDEVRLLESRKSARLADSDTDFARLADMGSDRKRSTFHSMDMPQIVGTRKRLPSASNDSWTSCSIGQDSQMEVCSAAMALISLSISPKFCPDFLASQWMLNGSNRAALASPGVSGTSVSSSSSASWRTGTPSPQLSDEGAISINWTSNNHNHSNDNNNSYHQNDNNAPANQADNQRHYPYPQMGSLSSSPNSPNDEGIVYDVFRDRRRKRKIRRKVQVQNDTDYASSPSGSPNPANDENIQRNVEVENTTDYASSTNDDSQNEDSPNSADNVNEKQTIFKCTYRLSQNVSCNLVSVDFDTLYDHISKDHLKRELTEKEEDFYITEEPLKPECSPPTKSHWDMVRPRSEDPEYQNSLRLAATPGPSHHQLPTNMNGQDVIINDDYTVSPTNGPIRHVKSAASRHAHPYASNVNLVTLSFGKMPGAPRRVRGETKKCRKIYGMEQKDKWCTQCKWKKACSRFSD